MTPYDAWRTNVADTNEEAWEDAVDQVAHDLSERTDDLEEFVSIVANADDALNFLCGAITLPDHHLHAFRDIVKLAQRLRKDVETEMKTNRSYPDGE